MKADGYTAVQSWSDAEAVLAAGLRASGMGRVMQPHEPDAIARAHKALGLDATTLHVGDSFETDAQIDTLVGAVLEASARHAYPLYIETHRATITQDLRRTLDMVERWPDVRFNADLSHWYTGHELTYGGEFLNRVERLQPVFDRVRFMHGRIGNAGAIQTALSDPGPYVDHHRLMWQKCFEGFLAGAQPGDYLSFNPELLPMSIGGGAQTMWIHYAQPRSDLRDDEFGGEPSDRYADAHRLWEIACECFTMAQQQMNGDTP
ncbi:hypothetical protein [Roseateles sp.]|uniref:hypothetical protein n=1 Tax=Roseateles sp. TaxID=1971397 RepID=UPI003D0DF975